MIGISIFHTNDMHGHLENMARLSHFIRRLRADAQAAGRLTFLWDAGDAADRRVEVCSATKGAAFQPILAAMGYTLQTLGNDLSITYGPQIVPSLIERGGFPILAANLQHPDGSLLSGLKAFVIIDLPEGVRMGVLGLTAPLQGMYSFFGLCTPGAADRTAEIMPQMQNLGAKVILVLSHLGLPDDRLLAQQRPDLAVIIGGHTHDLLPAGEVENGVLIAQAGDKAMHVGRVDLEIDASGRVHHRSAMVLPLPQDEPADDAVLAAIAAAEQEALAALAAPVGELKSPLELDYFTECSLGNFAADALAAHMGAEAAMLCTGNLRAPLAAGVVTRREINAASISTANPGLTIVSGAQILAALERSLDPAMSERMDSGFRGAPWGILQLSGLRAVYDLARPVGQRVRAVYIGDAILEPERSYRLAHTDAESHEQHPFLVLLPGQTTHYDVPTIVPEFMEAYLRRISPVAAPLAGRWTPAAPSAA